MPALVAQDHILDLAWSPGGDYLAAAEVSGPIHTLDSEQRSRTWKGHQLGTTSLRWHPQHPLLASCGQDGRLRFWSPESPEPRLDTEAPARWCNRLDWHRKGKWLAVAGGKQVGFYSQEGNLAATSEPHSSTISDLAWMPHEEVCVTAGYLGMQSWRPDRKEPMLRYHWQGSSLRLAISPNQQYIATGDQDRTVHFWRSKKPSADDSAMMSGFATKVEQLSWDSESRYLATGGSSDVCLWDCLKPGPQGRPPKVLKGNPDAFITALSFQPKGYWLASGNELGELCLWRPARDREPALQWKLESAVSALAWSPRGDFLAVGCAQGEIYRLPSPN